MPDVIAHIEQALRREGDASKKELYQKFFQTGPGQYAEGDVFLCVTVPKQRQIVKQFLKQSDLNTVHNLLHSEIHEFRLTALLLLVALYERSKSDKEKKKYVDFYLENLDWVNHWDLVDSSAHKLLGDWLRGKKDRRILKKLAKSGHLWSERVAVVANWTLMKDGDYSDLLWLAEYFLDHEHDLIHKAVGWMLREMGKLDIAPLRTFLNAHAHEMPRTMLRYAIEKLDEKERKKYLGKK